MHARDLLELAAVVASHAPTLLAPQVSLATPSLERYWTASKSRLDRWGHALKRLAGQGSAFRQRERTWLMGARLVEEILASEVLTRVWTAYLAAHDRRRQVAESEPIGQSIYVGHLEARNRAVHLLLCDPSIPAELAVRLNRLRRRAERWTDLLIGRMLTVSDVSAYAAMPQRCREFADDLQHQEEQAAAAVVWPLTLSALRGAFAEGLDPLPANPDLNAAIANSILGACGAEPFDNSGLLRSAWMARLTAVSDDTELLLSDYFSTPPAPTASATPVLRGDAPHRPKHDRFSG
ncbi:MAG: hypothetical protein JNG90_04465 [Planctomycetaceae bacterium]|nr:hypothetical protein [Planctomycetaceae bacterium]